MSNPVYIPTLYDETPYYTQRTTLDGVDYQLQFQWSARESRWYVSLLTTAGALICGPLKVLTNWPLLRWYKQREGCPAGELLAMSLSQDSSPPGLTDFGIGRRCSLVYVPADA
jgi:hypothetical protein